MDTERLKRYMGDKIPLLLEGYRREVYEVNWRQLRINYGDNVEFQRLGRQVLWCEATEEAIYAPPKPVKYRRGSRPELERRVREICSGKTSERDKVIALMCFCRDLYKKHDDEQLFYGGTEEELIKKGERLCECLGRLMVALCEVAGIPGRIVMHVISGHITCEVYFECKWAYIDPRCGLFYLDGAGRFASVREITRYPEITENQPRWVRELVSPLWSFEYRAARNRNKCLSDRELQCFCDYSLSEADEYGFEWKSLKRATADGLFVINKRYLELTELLLGGKDQ